MGLKEEDTLIQENIQEFVHDDNKIVTCKWLSLTLSIPTNSAKLALFDFVEKARDGGNNDDVNVSYFVSGFDSSKDSETKTLKCMVVPECHLDSVKQTLDPVTSCHVYSVQKAKLKDYTPLYQADYDVCRENAQALTKFSSISCPWAVLRDNQPEVKQEESVVTKPSNKETEATTKSKSSSSASSSSSTTTSSNGNSSKKTVAKKGAIASMFAAAEKKEKKVEKPGPKDSSSNKNTKAKADAVDEKKGMQSFLKAQPASGSKGGKEKELSPKESNTKQKNQKANDKKLDKSSKHKLSEKDEPQKKKRRRIRNDLFDSSDEEKNDEDDDDDEEEEEEDEAVVAKEEESDEDTDVKKRMEVEEEEEEEEEEKEEPKKEEKTKSIIKEKDESSKTDKKETVKDGKKRKRTRKLVPRQHIDEDGFMVTEKVWESDSTDASDEEETTKKTKPVSPAAKVNSAPKSAPQNKKKPTAAVSPSKNKQTSLMSFFKKK